MAEAIALIVAGSGEVTEEEVRDLLDDAYPDDDYEEIGLIVPVDKDLHTETVRHVVKWYGLLDAVYPVQTKGTSLSRTSAKLGDEDGPISVEDFKEVLDPVLHAEWDQVHFLVALPDEDDPDHGTYVEMVETAIDNGMVVKNLARGLDDVTLADEPEPEPEPEPPARKSRARKRSEPKSDEKVSEQVPESVPVEDVHDEVAAAVRELNTLPKTGLDDRDVVIGFLIDVQEAVQKALSALLSPLADVEDVEPTEPPAPAEETTPRRGRGRPRSNFEVRQVWDEDEENWVPRPAGRLKKGTKWRTIHAETSEVLEEGPA